MTFAKQLLAQLDIALANRDIDAQLILGNQLSHWVCDCSGNVRLAHNWSRLTSQTRMYFHTSLRNSDPSKVSEPWHELIGAMERRDFESVRMAVRNLVRRTLGGLGLSSDL
jgi:DNA-binding GntR family transcriptional regulator